MATIRLRIEGLCSSKIAAGCDGGKKTSVRILLAGYSAISVRITAYMYILVKNSHQIRNQHLRFTLELLNDPEVTRAFAEIRSKRGATNAIVILEKLRSRMFTMGKLLTQSSRVHNSMNTSPIFLEQTP